LRDTSKVVARRSGPPARESTTYKVIIATPSAERRAHRVLSGAVEEVVFCAVPRHWALEPTAHEVLALFVPFLMFPWSPMVRPAVPFGDKAVTSGEVLGQTTIAVPGDSASWAGQCR
jgi:hypothetical protein